jgi:hypothetical protein
MVWIKAGTTTLSSAGDNIDSGTITANKFNQTLSHEIASGNTTAQFTFNGSTGSEYASRWSNNGGSENVYGTQSSFDGYLSSSTAYDIFNLIFNSSIVGEEKLSMMFTVDTGGSGAGNAPQRAELVSKYVPSSLSTTITRIECDNTGSGSFDTDSNITILGSDATDILPPTNVQDNSLFVDKVNANRYWFTPQTVDTEEAFSFTTTDTVGALWGNRIYGMKLLSGHSGLNKYIKKAKTYHPTNPTGSRLTTGTLYHVILDSSGTEIARSAGVSASSVSNNSWAETTFSSPVKLLENYTVGMTISTGDANTYLGIGVNNNSSSPTNTTRYYKDQSGSESTATTETILMVFDSDPATGISIPATWTMETTYEDDFSSDSGYTFTSGNSISGGVLTAKPAGSLGFTKPLGFTLDNTFMVRIHGWEVQSGYSWSSSMAYYFGFSDTATNTAYNGSGNAWGFKIFNRNSGGMINNIWTKLSGSTSSGGNSSVGEGGTNLVVGTKYYIEMKKTGNGSAELRIYSDSDFTTLHTAAWISDTAMSNPTGLDHFALQGQTTGGTHVAKLDKIEIWNGVTSIN